MKKFIGIVSAITMASVITLGAGIAGAEEVTVEETAVEAGLVLGEKTENAISMEISNGTNGNITFFNVVEVKDIETEEGKKQLQEALKGKNLYDGEIDGSVGPMTMEAVAKFNKDSGLGDKATLEESVVMALGGDAEDNMLPKDTRFEIGATATLYVTPSEEVEESAEEVTIDESIETLATAANSIKYMAITKFEGNENLAFIHVLPIGEAETFEVRYDKGIVFVAYENEEGEEVTTYDLEYQYRVEQYGEEETKAMVEEATKAEQKAIEEGVQNPIQPIGYVPTTPVVDETTLPEAPHALTDEGRTYFVTDDNGNTVTVPNNQETTTTQQTNTQPQDYDHNKYEMGPDGRLYEKTTIEGNNPMEVNDPVPEPEPTTTPIVEQPTEKEKVWVVDKAAWDEPIEVVDQAAYTETIEHPEEGHYETKVVQEAYDEEGTTIYICDCGVSGDYNTVYNVHFNSLTAEDYVNCDHSVATDYVPGAHHDAVTEQVWVVDKAAWTETKNHPAVTHTEIIHHDEVGHWE